MPLEIVQNKPLARKNGQQSGLWMTVTYWLRDPSNTNYLAKNLA
jgi:hypothetical protein